MKNLISLLVLFIILSLSCSSPDKTREPDRPEVITIHMNSIQVPESFRAGLIIYDTIGQVVNIRTYTCYLRTVSSPDDSTYLTGTAHLIGNVDITLPIKE